MKNSKNLWTAFQAMVLAIFFCFAIAQLHAQTQPKLLQGSSLTTQNLNATQLANYQKLANREFVSSVSLITLNSLASASNSGNIKAQMPGNSCGEVTFKTKFAEYETANSFKWEGELITLDTCDCADGYFYLEARNGRQFGHISLNGTYYEIHEIGNSQYALAEFSSNDWSGEECTVDSSSSENFFSPTSIQDRDGDHCVVRLLVVYNQSASDSVGGTAAINDLVYHAVGQTKIALENSEVISDEFEIVLAGVEMVNFTQTSIFAADEVRDNLSTNTTIKALRDANGADVVALITGDDYFGERKDTAGVVIDTIDVRGSTAMVGPPDSLAYLLVEYSTATSKHTFAHEFAHIFGCRHEFASDTTSGIMHGHKFNIGSCFLNKKYRKTIMTLISANDQRITHYSNPNVTYYGKKTGTAVREYNAQQLRNSACTVADFRGSNETPLNVSITGKKIGCPCDVVILTAELSGGPSGTYSYEWSVSQDGGINYGGVESTTSILQTDFPCPNEGVFKVRLKVTTPNSDIVYKYANITASNHPPGEECGHGGGLIGVGGDKSNGFNLIVYPNPATGTAKVEFDKKEAGTVFVKIVNFDGSVVSQSTLGYFEAGQNTAEVPILGLNSGFYSIFILDKEGKKTAKLVINNK